MPASRYQSSCRGNACSLSEQVGYFEKTVRPDLPRYITSKDEQQLHLEKSIVVISLAGNYYLLSYLLDEEMRAKHDITSYTELLIQSLAANIERMADLGAKKLIVRGMPSISCLFLFFKIIRRQCDELGDKIVPLYNCLLVEALDRLKSKHGILYTIIVPEKIDARIVAAEIGSKFTYRPCCKVNEFGGCAKDSEPCKNRDEFLHIYSAHPTQVYHKYAADRCFDGTSRTCKPYCIDGLSGK